MTPARWANRLNGAVPPSCTRDRHPVRGGRGGWCPREVREDLGQRVSSASRRCPSEVEAGAVPRGPGPRRACPTPRLSARRRGPPAHDNTSAQV
jgi:hypothetical protein